MDWSGPGSGSDDKFILFIERGMLKEESKRG